MSIKLNWILLFLISMIAQCVVAQSVLDQKINIHFENEHINDALLTLSENAHISIAFDAKLFNKENKIISKNYRDQSLEFILKSILQGTGVNHQLNNNHITLSQRPQAELIVSGYISDALSGEKMIGATIFDQYSGRGSISNDYGFFSLKIPPGKHLLKFSYLGYHLQLVEVNLMENRSLIIDLVPSVTLGEILVLEHDSMLRSSFISSTFINRRDLMSSVGNGGEPDIIHYLQGTNGVQSGSDGLGGLNVRGGNSDQNIILLDDAPIFQPSHAFGFFSIFNAETMRKATFQKEGFSAKYGGKLSSVLDIRTKEGNTKKLVTSLSTSALATSIHLEVPIVKNQSSLFLAARRTHIDPWVQRISKKKKKDNLDSGDNSYYFYDINAKFHSSITQNDKIYFSFYQGQDQYQSETKTEVTFDSDSYYRKIDQGLQWGNQVASIRWNHIYGSQLFSNITITNSRYNFSNTIDDYTEESYIDSTFIFDYQSYFSTNITDFRVKSDFNYYLNPHHKLNFGFAYLNRVFKTDIKNLSNEIEFEKSDSVLIEYYDDPVFDPVKFSADELDFYIEDQIKIRKHVDLDIGLHSAIFLNNGHQFFSLQPRINLNFSLSKRTRAKLNLSKMTQFLHVLTSSGGGLPTDNWVPATERFGPEDSWQFSSNVSHELGQKWGITLGGYYKTMTGLIEYIDFAKAPSIKEKDPFFWEEDVDQGTGVSYGLEFQLTRKSKGTTATFNYTFSKSERQFDQVNNGKKYPFIYDQTHNVNILIHQKISDHIQVNMDWQWHSGTPYTLFTSDTEFNPLDNFGFDTEDESGTVGQQSGRDELRLPNFHRLNVNLAFNWSSKKIKQSLAIGVTNLYNHKNIYYSYELVDIFQVEPNRLINKNTFPILPSLRYSIQF